MAERSNKRVNQDLIFGRRAVLEAIRAGREIDKLLLQRHLQGELAAELSDIAREYRVPVQTVPAERLNRVTRKNHQGAIAFLSAITYASLDHIIEEKFASGQVPFILLLDRITDVRNFGAIARSAECFGIDALVVPTRGSAQLGADAVKTSAGALHHIPVCREENLSATIRTLQASGLRVVACTEKAIEPLSTIDLTGPVALLLGSEEDGILPDRLRRSDALARIPLGGQIASLNVSVAAGVVLYEAIRQRGGQ